MNTRFLISPAYLFSITLMVAGAVLSGSRYMLIGWMLFLVGVFLNAMTLVILANREQLYQIRQAHQPQIEQREREQAEDSSHEPSEEPNATQKTQKDTAEQKTPPQQGSESESSSYSAVVDKQQDTNTTNNENTLPRRSATTAHEQTDGLTNCVVAVEQKTTGNAQSAQNMRRLKNFHKSRRPQKKMRR